MALQLIKGFSTRREGRPAGPLCVLAAALALGGCSMSIPGLIDAAPTGSNRSPTYPFAKEDWTKAEPALLAAIRADSGDDPAQWNNAETGRRGAVVAVGDRFAREGATCRAFVARIAENGDTRSVQGDACEKAGAVTVSGAAAFKGA